MTKILFIMGRYFPKASPNTICVQNIVDKLSEENDIYILCYEDYKGEENNNKIIKVSRGLLHNWIYRNEDKKGKLAAMQRKFLHYSLMARQLLTYSWWPWTDPIFTARELRVAKRIVEIEKINIIVGVYFPLSSLIVARKLKEIYPYLKYYSYFLDSLTGGSVPKLMRRKKFEKHAEAWEQKVTSNADMIIFMESSREFHTKLYEGFERCKHIEYLDLPMLKQRDVDMRPTKRTIEFVYIGSLTSSIRSPNYLLRVFMLSQNPLWTLTFVGDDNCEAVNAAMKKDSRIKAIGRCSHDVALQYEQNADIFINLGNNNPNLTPSKIFEYMSWGKKIISTYPIENESSLKYLRKYPKALLLDERNTNIREALESIERFVDCEDVAITYKELAKIFRNNTPEAFASLMRMT